jgi:hypothetical protein
MQQRVQQEILRLIDDAGVVDVRAVSRRLPETDERDLTRALQILLGEGLIERETPLSSQTQEKSAANIDGPVHLTDAGHQRLAAL